MKSLRVAVFLPFLLAVTAAFAQSHAKSIFEHLKSLNGNWEGKANDSNPVKVTFRPTGGGSAIMSEIVGEEDMISMFHLDNDRVLMTHYCATGNQPRMQASMSPDGKTITFTFVDATNLAGPKAGHMDRLVITIADADHHSEDWTFVQDGKETKEHFDLARAKTASM
jgi:hypothetical protein